MSVFDNIKLPKVIEEVESPINGKISIVEVGSTRKLCVGNVAQSVNWDSQMASRHVWGRLVDKLYEEMPNLKSVMVLGLGGGSMQHLLSKKFPGIYITSVEIDKVVVDLAKKYFRLDDIPNHRIIIADALRVVAVPEEYGISKQSMQAVVVDIFCGEKYPELGASGNFINCLRELVIPGGLVVFNRIYFSHLQDEVNEFVDLVEGFFSDVKSVILAGRTNSDNVLIICKV